MTYTDIDAPCAAHLQLNVEEIARSANIPVLGYLGTALKRWMTGEYPTHPWQTQFFTSILINGPALANKHRSGVANVHPFQTLVECMEEDMKDSPHHPWVWDLMHLLHSHVKVVPTLLDESDREGLLTWLATPFQQRREQRPPVVPDRPDTYPKLTDYLKWDDFESAIQNEHWAADHLRREIHRVYFNVEAPLWPVFAHNIALNAFKSWYNGAASNYKQIPLFVHLLMRIIYMEDVRRVHHQESNDKGLPTLSMETWREVVRTSPTSVKNNAEFRLMCALNDSLKECPGLLDKEEVAVLIEYFNREAVKLTKTKCYYQPEAREIDVDDVRQVDVKQRSKLIKIMQIRLDHARTMDQLEEEFGHLVFEHLGGSYNNEIYEIVHEVFVRIIEERVLDANDPCPEFLKTVIMEGLRKFKGESPVEVWLEEFYHNVRYGISDVASAAINEVIAMCKGNENLLSEDEITTLQRYTRNQRPSGKITFKKRGKDHGAEDETRHAKRTRSESSD